MKVGILGGGFGLYGYLPALTAGLGLHVVLPRRYQDTLQERNELRDLASRIDWVDSDEEVLNNATALVIARRPADQADVIEHIGSLTNLERVLLEKPVAPNPVRAGRSFDLLTQNGRSVEIGYNFRFMDWSRRLAVWLQQAGAEATLNIEWRFRAHHYANGLSNWKRHPSHGGGALRFYGIHLIGLLAELGYYDAVENSWVHGSSPDEAEFWSAAITTPGLPRCSLVVDSNANQPVFKLSGIGPRASANLTVALRDPFETSPAIGMFDRRTDALVKLCGAAFTRPAGTPAWLRASIDLWASIEQCTARVPNGGKPNSQIPAS